MPANTRFCAVQIEVICLHSSTHVQLRSTQLFKKTKQCTFESRSLHNMLHQHVSHVQCIMSCEVTFYVHGHFPSSSGGCGGLRNPFPKFCCSGAILLSILRCAWRNRLLLCGAIFGAVLWIDRWNQFGFLFPVHWILSQ